ncbi:MAG TPA: glutathione S-transferase N-terminal domain-containing protein [Kofleriaceae bacterium]|nr:glutathione S-transferase N-terminal domain-containing protein [Kofleriaceae bacterium]
MYTLYITNKNYSSWSLRPWVLMTELAIPFREQLVPYAPGAFASFSPSGRVPCLVDDDVVVWDSLAIAEYLAERHPGVWPADPRARAWARCAAAEMHAGFMTLRERCTMNVGIRVRLRDMPAALEAELARLAALWSDGLARFGGPFLAGPALTAVDAFYAPVAFRIQTYGLALPEPALAYAARLRALPAMERWKSAALAERWRDPMHEDEVTATGTVIEDLRAAP